MDNNVFDNNKELNSLYRKYGKDFIKILTNQLLTVGKKSSGQLIRSLSADLKVVANIINIQIKGEDYLQYVDQGRKPGSYPPLIDIERWCSIRNIPNSAAFPIARSIFKYGIKPTNVISKSLTIFNTTKLKELENDIAKIVEKEVAKRLKRIK